MTNDNHFFSVSVMAFSLLYWANYTEDRTKLRRKSEQDVLNDRVLSFSYDVELKVVNAHVQASMKDKSYKIMVSCIFKCRMVPLSVALYF